MASINKELAQFYQAELLVRKRGSRPAPGSAHATSGATAEGKTAATSEPVAPATVTVPLTLGNTCGEVHSSGEGGTDMVEWTAFVKLSNPDHAALIQHVKFRLHPTFDPAVVTVATPPYSITRHGWGIFELGVFVVDVSGGVHTLHHTLDFSQPQVATNVTIDVKPPPPAPVTAPAPAPAHSTATQPKKHAARRRNTKVVPHAHKVIRRSPRHAAEAEAAAAAAAAAAEAGTARTRRVRRRMEGVPAKEMHGSRAKPQWNAPLLITFCDEEARPGYNTMKAHEYTDDMPTLRSKIQVLAQLVRRARHCVAYTGAGISTASGINDYASKARDSVATHARRTKPRNPLKAGPTFAHFALAALHRAGWLKHWVQQNHDGLPQKAGYPQRDLNEIHGAWFDPSNPVVPMSGTLRTDLCEWMEEEEEAADLVLAMGTSLCGMNADRMVRTPGVKAAHGEGLGAVIVGLQRTQMDKYASLRLYAKIDEVMLLLAMELAMPVPLQRYRMRIPDEARVPESHTATSEPPEVLRHTFMVPYDAQGNRTADGTRRKWCLAPGRKIRVTCGPGENFKGKTHRVSTDGVESYAVALPCQREGSSRHGKGMVVYALGAWMVEAACRGELSRLPFVNVYY